MQLFCTPPFRPPDAPCWPRADFLSAFPSSPSLLSSMSSNRHAAYKSHGDGHTTADIKQRLKEQCIARVREQRASIIQRARQQRAGGGGAGGGRGGDKAAFSSLLDGGQSLTEAVPQDVASSFNAIIKAEVVQAKQRLQATGGGFTSAHPPSPDSPALSLSQQSSNSALSSSQSDPSSHSPPHSHLPDTSHTPTSASPFFRPAPSSSSHPSHPLPFPHSLLHSLPSASSMDSGEEEKHPFQQGDLTDWANLFSHAEYIALMAEMEEELKNEERAMQQVVSEGMQEEETDWLESEGDAFAQDYEDYLEESAAQKIPCPACRSGYVVLIHLTSSSLSLTAPSSTLASCSACGLSLPCHRVSSLSEMTSMLGDALEMHSQRHCYANPVFIIDHLTSSSSSFSSLSSSSSAPLQQLRLFCPACQQNEVIRL